MDNICLQMVDSDYNFWGFYSFEVSPSDIRGFAIDAAYWIASEMDDYFKERYTEREFNGIIEDFENLYRQRIKYVEFYHPGDSELTIRISYADYCGPDINYPQKFDYASWVEFLGDD